MRTPGIKAAGRVFAFVCAWIALSGSALAGDLYVSPNGSDSNPGSLSAPFRSIQKADQAASAGTVIHVAPGNYPGGFTTSKSGSASARIAFVSDVKWGAKIVGTGGSQAESAWFSRGDYVDINGFEIDGRSGAGLSWSVGIYLGGNSNVARNNKVHDICIDSSTFNRVSGGQGGAGILVDGWYGGLNSSAIGNVVYDIGPNDRNSNLVHGIYQSTSGSVINNVVYNIVGDGITSWHDAHDINIINNTVVGARGEGILVGAGDGGVRGGALSSRAGNYFNVINNIVVGNRKYGIDEEGRTGSNNYFYNNLAYDNGYGNTHLQNGRISGTIVADPRFVNASGGDFHLTSASPAINAGVSSSAPSTDHDGAARPQGGAFDIGAYEFGSGSTTNPTPTPVPVPVPQPPPSSGSVQIVIGGDPATGVYSVEAKTSMTGSLRVEFYDNGVLKATERSAPYCLTTEVAGACAAEKLGAGSHTIVVKVFSGTGTTVLVQASRTFIEGSVSSLAVTGVHLFAAKHSGKCMDVTDASMSKGAVLQQWTCADSAHKKFEVVPMGGNQFLLKARHSGQCLDVSGGSTANGAKITQWPCKGSDNQKFTFKDMGGGYYSIVSVKSGKCVDVSRISTENGAIIHQWDCHGGGNQLWSPR